MRSLPRTLPSQLSKDEYNARELAVAQMLLDYPDYALYPTGKLYNLVERLGYWSRTGAPSSAACALDVRVD